mmetsp:Transcript_20711/g.36514  ORF Transcript_20711/g.36514 Transcript_20711/m.36514 type:complete len:101 (-) Transcript_20711:368-670(-)
MCCGRLRHKPKYLYPGTKQLYPGDGLFEVNPQQMVAGEEAEVAVNGMKTKRVGTMMQQHHQVAPRGAARAAVPEVPQAPEVLNRAWSLPIPRFTEGRWKL